MRILSLTQFKELCLNNRISKFIYSTADQNGGPDSCDAIISLSFHSAFATLQPNCVTLKNDSGSIKFPFVKKIYYEEYSGFSYLFTIVCCESEKGEERRYKLIGYSM